MTGIPKEQGSPERAAESNARPPPCTLAWRSNPTNGLVAVQGTETGTGVGCCFAQQAGTGTVARQPVHLPGGGSMLAREHKLCAVVTPLVRRLLSKAS